MAIHLQKMRLAVPVLIACAVSLPSCQDSSSGSVEPSFAKGGNPGQSQPQTTLTFLFPLPDQESSLIVGDTRVFEGSFSAYTDYQCGVRAIFFGGSPYLSSASDRIKPSESDLCGGREERVFQVRFSQAYDVNGEPVELAWNGETADAKWFKLVNESWSPPVRNLPKGETVVKPLWITFVDQSTHIGGNGWGQACPGLLRFDEEWGATNVQITRVRQQSQRDTEDEWEIKSDGYVDENGHAAGDVAACLGANGSEFYLLGYYHVPFQVNVVCRTENPFEDC